MSYEDGKGRGWTGDCAGTRMRWMELAEDGPTGGTLGCSTGGQSARVPVWALAAARAGAGRRYSVALVQVRGRVLGDRRPWAGLGRAEQSRQSGAREPARSRTTHPTQGQAGTPGQLRIPQQGGCDVLWVCTVSLPGSGQRSGCIAARTNPSTASTHTWHLHPQCTSRYPKTCWRANCAHHVQTHARATVWLIAHCAGGCIATASGPQVWRDSSWRHPDEIGTEGPTRPDLEAPHPPG